MTSAYRAILFDLFGTLVVFEPTALPELVLDGRRIRSTLGTWSGLVEEALPGVGVDAFARAILTASVELDRVRRETMSEFPSRERFRRALALVGCGAEEAEELAPSFARAHMRGIAAATRFPVEHRDVLAQARARGGVAIITNFDDTATAYDILVRLGIREQVETVVVSEAVGLRKPHGALVRLALRDLGVTPAEALMIGDHALEDVGAATAAGVDAAWIDVDGIGVAATAPTPRYVVRSLPEVVPLFG